MFDKTAYDPPMEAPGDRSFLGTGWAFPPTFSRATRSVAMVSDEIDVEESLHILFSTSLGERVMVPRFGSQLGQRVFHGLTTTLLTELEELVRNAILYWEPRIELLDVEVKADSVLEGRVEIRVSYAVHRTNTRHNLVFPFYLREGTLVAAVAE